MGLTLKGPKWEDDSFNHINKTTMKLNLKENKTDNELVEEILVNLGLSYRKDENGKITND